MKGMQRKPRPSPIPARLRRLRARVGFTLEEMAHAAGLAGPSSWQRYEDEAVYKKDYLAPDMATRLAEALAGKGVPPVRADEILALAQASAARPAAKKPLRDSSSPDIDAVRLSEESQPQDESDVLPVYGAARGGDDQEMFLDDPIDWIQKPPFLRNVRGAYAMQVVGESMRPMYRSGQIVYVNPFRIPKPDMGVVVYKKNGAVLVKEFVRKTVDRLILKEYQPQERELELSLAEIKETHTIVGTREQ
jgi:phage repressor protein C with HTH and peptisase S24 domain